MGGATAALLEVLIPELIKLGIQEAPIVEALIASEGALKHAARTDVDDTTFAAIRSTISIAVPGGTNDIHMAKLPVGCCTTGNQTNMGNTTKSMIGMIMPCASLRSFTHAPTAMKSEPNSSTASTWYTRNQGTIPSGTRCNTS